MKNYITDLLDLGDSSAEIVDYVEENNTKIITIQKKEIGMTCSICGNTMHSKGKRMRLIKHPILQDGFSMKLNVIIRKWRCPNCNHYDHDHFSFLQDFKQGTSLLPFMILNEMRDLELTTKQVAERFFVSDTYVREVFMTNVSLPRLSFPEIICIDEVYMKYNKYDLYSLVLMDFKENQIIDMLPNRLQDTVEKYFLHIPLEERKNVKILVMDMYKPYLSFVDKYFPNATIVIDSFHVVSLIINKIHQYVNQVKRKYREIDEKRLQEKNEKNNFSNKTIKKSRELRLLERYEFFLLKNHDDINYDAYWRHIPGRGGYWYDPIQTEKAFMELDDKFEKIRDLKEMYIEFNKCHINDISGARDDLENIIQAYQDSNIPLFKDVATTLESFKSQIINSFNYVTDTIHHDEKENVLRRISNGPLEGSNVNSKNYKRQSRGVNNYEYTRNRILWSTRKNPSIRGIPLTRDEVKNHTGKKRGPYKKGKIET